MGNSLEQYDLNDYSCVNFAVSAFNAGRPGNPISFSPNGFGLGYTPNGLYNCLNTLKNTNPTEAPNISMGKLNAPTGHGECQ